MESPRDPRVYEAEIATENNNVQTLLSMINNHNARICVLETNNNIVKSLLNSFTHPSSSTFLSLNLTSSESQSYYPPDPTPNFRFNDSPVSKLWNDYQGNFEGYKDGLKNLIKDRELEVQQRQKTIIKLKADLDQSQDRIQYFSVDE